MGNQRLLIMYVVREDYEPWEWRMFRKILVPIDTDEPAVAEPAVYFATQLAALTNGAVRIIHVLPVIPLNLQEFLPPQVNADRENAVHSVLLEMAKKANVPMGLFSHTLRTGVVYDEVLAEAKLLGGQPHHCRVAQPIDEHLSLRFKRPENRAPRQLFGNGCAPSRGRARNLLARAADRFVKWL